MTKEDIKALTEIIISTQNQLSEQLADFKADIDARFKQIGARFDAMDAKFDARFAQVKGRLDSIDSSLDGIAARLDIDDTERVALSAQVTRLEDWAIKTAPIVKVKYTPGA